MASVLIIGASGILAPAASALVARGESVTGISLRRQMPDGVEVLHVDATDEDALAAAVDGRRWSAAIVYSPAITPRALRLVEERTDDGVVLVRASAAVDPAHGDVLLPPGVLQLGWHDDATSVRWHTPAEVSAAALEVVDDGRSRILGSIRPWERRP